MRKTLSAAVLAAVAASPATTLAFGESDYLAWFKAPGVLRELQSINLEARARLRGSAAEEALLVDPDVIERLRGLGYIND